MTAAPAPIRMAIIEDQREICEGLSALIAGASGYLLKSTPPARRSLPARKAPADFGGRRPQF